jgi:hypothetical protein
VRILFHVTLTTMLRHFESLLLLLADRGHTVTIASPLRRTDLPRPPALEDHERISFVASPGRRGDRWSQPIHELRTLRDALRYLERPYSAAAKLRERALRKLVTALSHEEHNHLVARCPRCEARLVDDEAGRVMLPLGKRARENLRRLLALMEDTIPSAAPIEDFLRSQRPDVVMVTPLINFGSYQADYVKSAKALGIPVGFPVFSWDNLSNKGLIHVTPDRVFVWNMRQRAEAVQMHGVPPEQVTVTGAPRFDEFFAMTPQTTREAFFAAHGLDAQQPLITYLCSSQFVAAAEVQFVSHWIEEIRRAPALRACNVLVRPHPREQKQWKGFGSGVERVALSYPLALNADQTLFDSVYHSAAVVGLNTSAQLEAAIVGRPVLTILAPPELASGQQGTVHFRYLLEEEGGFVRVAPDFDAHRRDLASAVSGASDADRIRTFVEHFLRPHGLERPATPILADAIEALARQQTAHTGLMHLGS